MNTPSMLSGIPPSVTAAAISSVVGLVVAWLTARWQARLKLRELDEQSRLKRKELDDIVERFETDLNARMETARQEQMAEILKKRAETYPKLYEITAKYGRSWELRGKPRNLQWCDDFLEDLLINNEQNGAFFSNTVYRWYGDLRDHVVSIRDKLSDGGSASDDDVRILYDIIRGPMIPGKPVRSPGLGSYIKNELGAEIPTFTSVLYEDWLATVRSARPRTIGPARNP
jgi:uncharacterized membrane-anchored protein YhcB (DUF1043 family)